jgi:Scd6-like Sm domain
LISKKNIRYEGTLYSINESNATVALQNVRSFGTEGREKIDPSATFVAPQDAVHAYLLFRGCDIKDLHVHESAAQQPPPDPAAKLSAKAPTNNNQRPHLETNAAAAAAPPQQSAHEETPSHENSVAGTTQEANGGSESQDHSETNGDAKKKGINNRQRKKTHTGPQVGTGASLLNRKVRGTKDGGKENINYWGCCLGGSLCMKI